MLNFQRVYGLWLSIPQWEATQNAVSMEEKEAEISKKMSPVYILGLACGMKSYFQGIGVGRIQEIITIHLVAF